MAVFCEICGGPLDDHKDEIVYEHGAWFHYTCREEEIDRMIDRMEPDDTPIFAVVRLGSDKPVVGVAAEWCGDAAVVVGDDFDLVKKELGLFGLAVMMEEDGRFKVVGHQIEAESLVIWPSK